MIRITKKNVFRGQLEGEISCGNFLQASNLRLNINSNNIIIADIKYCLRCFPFYPKFSLKHFGVQILNFSYYSDEFPVINYSKFFPDTLKCYTKNNNLFVFFDSHQHVFGTYRFDIDYEIKSLEENRRFACAFAIYSSVFLNAGGLK